MKRDERYAEAKTERWWRKKEKKRIKECRIEKDSK